MNKLKQSVLASSMIAITACGGGGGGGQPANTDANNQGTATQNNASNTGQNTGQQSAGAVAFSSGTWNIKANFSADTSGDFPIKYDSVLLDQQILNFEDMVMTDCEFNVRASIIDDDYSGDLESLSAELEEDMEQSFADEFTTTVTRFSDTHILIEGSSATGDNTYSFEFKKVSNSLAFNSGQVSMSGDGINGLINANQNVCANYSQTQYYGSLTPRTNYTFGVPYEDTRLVVHIEYDGMDLTPGVYDLTLQEDISISVDKIDLPEEAYEFGSTSPVHYYDSTATTLKSGTLVIEEASVSTLKGSVSFDSYFSGAFSADFNVTFPQ